jgi:hypothetical protein
VFTELGLTVTVIGGGDELLLPQATMNPVRAKARQRPTIL